tara:strand:+ start:706 stop:885 length:180 start_codon:yes stop_codon:yes gene_type:complete
MNNQGKTDKQYNDSAKAVGYSIIGMIILMIFVTLSTGCTTTKECCKNSDEIIEHYENKK